MFIKIIITNEMISLSNILYKVLFNLFPLISIKTHIKNILNKLIYINKKQCIKKNFKLKENDLLEIKKNNIYILYIYNNKLNIIYEDIDILIINKYYNSIVYSNMHSNNTILNELIYYYPPIINIPNAGIIHRLDKNTTGLILIAKNINSYNKLLFLLKEKYIIREYEGIVLGNLNKSGKIIAPILRHPKYRTFMIINKLGKKSITYYNIIEIYKKNTRLRIRLQTGRTHQIRIHMAYIKYNILGDNIYNKKKFLLVKEKQNLLVNRQMLHASMLRFNHPIYKNIIEIIIPLPNDIKNIIKFIKNNC